MSKRGHPDYGQYAGVETVAPVADLGELAARLGSPNVFERSGNTIFQSSFEDGIMEFLVQTAGVGSAVAVETGRTFKGGKSAKLTADSGAGDWAGIIKRVRPISLTKMGIEATFSVGSGLDRLTFNFQLNNGSKRWRWAIGFYAVDDEIKIRNDEGNYEKLVAYDFDGGDPDLWHTAKLVVDLDSKAYVRLIINEVEYNLSDYTGEEVVDTTVKRIEPSYQIKNVSSSGGDGYFDCVIITINEP